MSAAAKLTLGPVLFNWPVERWRDFYFRIADEAPIDTVYLGEVVCSKRAPFFEPHVPEVAERLTRAGKEVVHSTLALVMSAREAEQVRALSAESDLFVEANDLSAVRCLAGRPHVIGPFVNVYNEGTLAYLAGKGAVRAVLGCELRAETMAELARAVPEVDLEVQAFGRLPLALSARCYHARGHGLHKDGCQYVCGEDSNGLLVSTLDDEPFLAVNGTQTMSFTIYNLVAELSALCAMGIGGFRLWPHDIDMVAVAEVFRAVLDARLGVPAATARLAQIADFAPFSNGFYHGVEGVTLRA